MVQLDDKLGLLLLQMPPQWGASAMADLERFLPLLPPGQRVALEVRHKSWLATETFAEPDAACSRRTGSRSAWCSTRGCPRSRR